MSLRRLYTFHNKTLSEYNENYITLTSSVKKDEKCRTVSKLSPSINYCATTVSVNFVRSVNEPSDCVSVSQVPETDFNSKHSFSDNESIKEFELNMYLDPDYSQSDDNLSLAIPDGMVLDPLTPTTLAVTTNLMDRIGTGISILREHGKKVQKYVWKNRKFDFLKKAGKSMVNIVLIEAKDLLEKPSNGSSGLYCKFRLGNETHKSRQVSISKPMWCERFNIYMYDENNLEISVWQKGKQKTFVGKSVIDLSQLQKEKTHDLWVELECGSGALHMLVTLNGSTRTVVMDNIPTTNGVQHPAPPTNEFSWYRLNNNWSEVGQLSVTVYGAKGLSPLALSGRADAYCVLELDNSMVQTHTVSGTSEPMWNKNYTFAVNDITSTLDIKIHDESLIVDTLGKLSIPLLRINNDEKRWYALKDKSKKSHAKGNCPRILLQMSLVWNPIKASFRVLSPKEMKYTEKPQNKFNIPLLYNNLQFVKDIFQVVRAGHEHLKYLFEWDNREKSTMALVVWLVFWYLFQTWMTPLLLIIPFIYFGIGTRSTSNNTTLVPYMTEDESSDEDLDTNKDEQTLKSRLNGLQDLTFTIKYGIDYIVSLIERVRNLINFTVPYLSYLAIAAMIALSMALYIIPINYILMALGIYKFSRKYLNPDRVPNNDILDFISRVPDDRILRKWQELNVPEQNLNGGGGGSYKSR